MEKVCRCWLSLPRGFVVASAVLTFVRQILGTMLKAKGAVRWHREAQTVVYTKSLGLRVVSKLSTLQAQSSLFALAW